MNDFDQARADRHAALYNTDGRLFDIVETDENLELRSRPNAFSYDVLGAVICAVLACLVRRMMSSPLSIWLSVGIVVVSSLLNWLVFQTITRFFGIYEPNRWTFNRGNGFLCADNKKLAPLAEISHLRGFRFFSRLKLVVVLKNGREFHLGAWRFGGKEHAWRHDAAQIAAFLGVPLEIPPF